MKSILIEGSKGTFHVSNMDAEGGVLRRFKYANRQRAHTAAKAWAPAHENCPIDDRTSARVPTFKSPRRP